jgi:hypothetical protein
MVHLADFLQDRDFCYSLLQKKPLLLPQLTFCSDRLIERDSLFRKDQYQLFMTTDKTEIELLLENQQFDKVLEYPIHVIQSCSFDFSPEIIEQTLKKSTSLKLAVLFFLSKVSF